MASAFTVPLILTFAFMTSTCDGVRLANYIPILQGYPAGRDDLIESYFHLGLEYTETLLFDTIHVQHLLTYNSQLRNLLQKAICMMASFDYNYHNPSVFLFVMLIRAIRANLNNKESRKEFW